nr:MAG TPA_asm: hypothetical protein [Caudoviricetes sp.]
MLTINSARRPYPAFWSFFDGGAVVMIPPVSTSPPFIWL